MAKINYPIKYTIMAIDQNGNGEGYDDFISFKMPLPIAFIVSKCYLVGEEIKYFENGKMKKDYDVVFPFALSDLDTDEKLYRTIPSCNFAGKYMEAVSTTYVFDSLEDALQVAKECNAKLLHEKIRTLQSDAITTGEKVANIKERHDQNLKKWKDIEQKILDATSDIVVISTSLEDLIGKVIERPKEFYAKLAEALSPEERKYLKKLLQNRSCMNCMNPICKVVTCEKTGLDEVGKSQGSECLVWDNPELIGRLLLKMKS